MEEVLSHTLEQLLIHYEGYWEHSTSEDWNDLFAEYPKLLRKVDIVADSGAPYSYEQALSEWLDRAQGGVGCWQAKLISHGRPSKPRF
jgi:hypothetical protein